MGRVSSKCEKELRKGGEGILKCEKELRKGGEG